MTFNDFIVLATILACIGVGLFLLFDDQIVGKILGTITTAVGLWLAAAIYAPQTHYWLLP
ncbi:hypothetical protein T281_06890 [Rhodomicrobium udaipurense JA643]|uniref:Uncharacterized protein n=1 Tax=Rhodomicrobium udaipurense TaxID=1202716 RepID=A0A8I1GE63_9HYPH|nr:hypothetical protein [Rhodomicrobium udaipurense]KAI95197.1 hypothetical protein T281_06890 [Rhodomicrobium udaipurense JA643]MBJ7541956.1 hypothetical protein [Rhodomicrobium udaipurense]